MDIHYLWGDDSTAVRRRIDELTTDVDRVDRVDAASLPTGSTSALPALAATPSLFGGTRALVVTNASTLPPATFQAVNTATAALTGGLVVFVAANAPAQPVRKAVRRMKIDALNLPATKTFPKFIVEEASRSGVRLSTDATATLVERTSGNPDRVRSVLAHLAAAGIRHPKPRQIELLSGSASAVPTPWDVTDAVERGDTTTAYLRAQTVEPFAFAGWVRKRVAQIEAAAKILDAAPTGSRAGSVVAEGLGVAHWQAQRLARLARTANTEELWGVVVGLDDRLRSTGVDASAAILVAVAGYATHANT